MTYEDVKEFQQRYNITDGEMDRLLKDCPLSRTKLEYIPETDSFEVRIRYRRIDL